MRIVIPGVDVGELLDMIEHLDETIRELALIATGMADGIASATVDLQVLAVMDRSRPVLFAAKEAISAQVAQAWEEGATTVDVVVDVPAGAGPAVLDALDAFEAVDEACAGDGALLLPEAPAEVRKFRRWFFTRVADELERRGR